MTITHKRYRYIFAVVVALLAALPHVAFAQTTLFSLIDAFGNLVTLATTVGSGIALLVFVWGLVKFIANAGNETEREKGKQVMFWGIIALFVLFSIWGIVNFLQKEVGLNGVPTQVNPPQIVF